ncbi:MAG: dihydrodipicolinate synthase family protein [Actinomycetota bacterium]|nr:dihydrodipicolinate synthase family protein [Actinomycetota bacterium]
MRPTAVVPALLTPLADGGGTVDLSLLDAHVAWLHERGIRAVSPLGTTGEGVSLALDERMQVIERLTAHPTETAVIPGTGCTALPETIELSRFAAERGAAAVLLAPPSYYDPFDVRGVTAYFVAVFEALPSSSRVLLYNIPRHTGIPIEDETLRALGERFGPMLAGMKDSGGDIDRTRRWVRDFPELAIFNGSDASAAVAFASGCAGVVTMLANAFPGELEGIRRGDDVERRQSFLAAVRALVHELPRHAALKHLLHLVSGLPRSSVRAPLQELDDEQTAMLETRFSEFRREAHV